MNSSSGRGSSSRQTGRRASAVAAVATASAAVAARRRLGARGIAGRLPSAARMTGYLKRLLASSAAYQAASLLSAALGLLTLPLYTRHLSPSDYGYAETLLTFVIFGSI